MRDEYALLEKKVRSPAPLSGGVTTGLGCHFRPCPFFPQLTHLRREKATLDEEMSTTRLDPAEARDKLLARVKEDNARIQVIDRALKLAEEDNAARRKAIQEATAEIEERRGEAGDSSKYEMLFKRGEDDAAPREGGAAAERRDPRPCPPPAPCRRRPGDDRVHRPLWRDAREGGG